MTTPRDDIAGLSESEPTQEQIAACERAMDVLEAQADIWAEEITLVNIVKIIGDVSRGLTDRMPSEVRANFINRQEAQIDALARQAYLEGFDRGVASRKEYDDAQTATQLDSLLKERDALRNEINDWANEVARYKSYAEKFDQENAALQVRVKELEASQQRQFDKYQAALKSGATSPPTEEGIAAAIRQTEYKYFGDYEFSESQWDAVHCLVNAAHHYLTAEARVKELEAQLAVADATLLRLNSGKELQDLMRLNNELESRATRAEQERDEAYERASKAVCSGCATGEEFNGAGYHDHGGFTFPCHATAIRRLASGDEKEKK